MRLPRSARCSSLCHINPYSPRRYLAASRSLICPSPPRSSSPPFASLTLLRSATHFFSLTRPGTSLNAAMARSNTARSGARSLYGRPSPFVGRAFPSLLDAGGVSAFPAGARLAVALLNGGPVESGCVGAARGLGTDWPAWLVSGRNRIDGVGARVESLTTTGDPATSEAYLLWNESVSIFSCLALFCSGVWRQWHAGKPGVRYRKWLQGARAWRTGVISAGVAPSSGG